MAANSNSEARCHTVSQWQARKNRAPIPSSQETPPASETARLQKDQVMRLAERRDQEHRHEIDAEDQEASADTDRSSGPALQTQQRGQHDPGSQVAESWNARPPGHRWTSAAARVKRDRLSNK